MNTIWSLRYVPFLAELRKSAVCVFSRLLIHLHLFQTAYQTTLADAVRYADDLLEQVKSKFCKEFSSTLALGGKKVAPIVTEIDFSENFDKLLTNVEQKYAHCSTGFCTSAASAFHFLTSMQSHICSGKGP